MMKFLIPFLFLPLVGFGQNADKVLMNVDIIKLSKLDLPASVIISKIKTSHTHFDVDVDALVELKKQGVSGEVITEMMSASAKEEKQISMKKDFNDPKTMRSSGIYYYNPKETNSPFIAVDPTVVSSSKSGGFGTAVAQHYSYGIAKNKHKSSLSGSESRRQISESSPTFYFYFSTVNGGQLLFASGSSPNEFALVKLIENDNNREMVVGSSNAYEHDIGIDAKQMVPFTYDQVASGIYKIILGQPLERGEYCFIYTSATPGAHSNTKVYDFGINVDVPGAKK